MIRRCREVEAFVSSEPLQDVVRWKLVAGGISRAVVGGLVLAALPAKVLGWTGSWWSAALLMSLVGLGLWNVCHHGRSRLRKHLWHACTRNDTEQVERLLDAFGVDRSGGDVDRLCLQGWRLLLLAVQADSVEVARLLLQRGAEANEHKTDAIFLPPLWVAHSVPMIELLLLHGANPNHRFSGGSDNRVPLLHFAVTNHRSSAVVMALLKGGATDEFVNFRGHTALDEARRWGMTPLVATWEAFLAARAAQAAMSKTSMRTDVRPL